MISFIKCYRRSALMTRDEMVRSFNRNLSAQIVQRSLNIRSPRFPLHSKNWLSLSFSTLVVVFLVGFLIFAFGSGYLYFVPTLSQVTHGFELPESSISIEWCDFSDGHWVKDNTYPLYNASNCPFAERGFNCLANGRNDRDYQTLRWKPHGCELPRFDVRLILERLRGKRIVFVGDSMSRTQWESMICLLMTGVEDKNTVYEVNRNKISKQIRFLGVQFSSFNFTIEFFRSVFLVQLGAPPRYGPRRVRSTLRLDRMDEIHHRWNDSDVLIFNTGQWWTPEKLFEAGCYFQVEGSLKLGMPITSAFRLALLTWSSWVESMVDANRTHVFFRTFEPSHWSNGPGRGICRVTREPMSTPRGKDHNTFADIALEIISNMTVPPIVLHATSMGATRSDAHVGAWSDMPNVPDCSHWCLPGVPDAWNELMFSYLLGNHKLSS